MLTAKNWKEAVFVWKWILKDADWNEKNITSSLADWEYDAS